MHLLPISLLLSLSTTVCAAPALFPTPGLITSTVLGVLGSLTDPTVRQDLKSATKTRIISSFTSDGNKDRNASANPNCPNLPDGSPLLIRNELTNPGSTCKPVTVIYARGTSNDGNVGNDVGPCFLQSLGNIVGAENIAVQGVNNYPATVKEFLQGGSATGAGNIKATLAFAQQNCPSTAIVLSGFSQGAQIMHLAAEKYIPQTQQAWNQVAAVMLFGDPNNGTAFPVIDSARVITDCHTGDAICAHSDFILAPHHTYEADSDGAAAAVAKLLPQSVYSDYTVSGST